MDFNKWARKMGLDDKTINALEREDLDDYDALRAVSEKDLNDIHLTIGMRALLKRAVGICKNHDEGRDADGKKRGVNGAYRKKYSIRVTPPSLPRPMRAPI